RSGVSDRAGGLVQAYRQTCVPDGADPSPFRAARLDRAADRDPVLDHLGRARARGAVHAEAAMIPVTTVASKTVAVFGLGGSGLVSARALDAGGAEVIACDDNPKKMAEAAEAGIAAVDVRHATRTRR